MGPIRVACIFGVRRCQTYRFEELILLLSITDINVRINLKNLTYGTGGLNFFLLFYDYSVSKRFLKKVTSEIAYTLLTICL